MGSQLHVRLREIAVSCLKLAEAVDQTPAADSLRTLAGRMQAQARELEARDKKLH